MENSNRPDGVLSEAVRGFAAESAVTEETVWRAAQLKTASVLNGAPELSDAGTWRDLLRRVAQEPGRGEAEAAWNECLAAGNVGVAVAEGCLLSALNRLTSTPGTDHRLGGLLTAEQAETLVEASAGPVKPLPNRRFHEFFEERVRRHADTVAAVQGDRSWTYDDLNQNANKIAWYLVECGLGPEEVVAVVTERTLEWLAAVVGIFKAGCCYLPIEPHFPAERISMVLRRSECRWALTERSAPHLAETLASRDVTSAVLDDVLAAPGRTGNPGVPVAADQLAYIYFTSGSTGEPKGVMCEQAGFLNHLLAKIEDLGIEEGDVIAQTAPAGFDISLWQLVAALMVGGRTHIIEQEVILDADRFVAFLREAAVRVVQLVPSYLDVVCSVLADQSAELPRLRTVAVTGEALKMDLVQRWFARMPAIPLVNCYGSTEASDDTNHGVLRSVPDRHSVPLGPPTRNVRVYVMDELLQLVPPGAPGEITFAGVCVGRGYVNEPERTAAVFGQDPYRPQDRLYRSGDFGRRLPSGEFEYLGRTDSLVKVNGFRIETFEIENRMVQVGGVRDGAIVIAGPVYDPQIVGYYSGPAAPPPETVAQALTAVLPEYMVPRRLYRLERLPLSANGKIDRKALTKAAGAKAAEATDVHGFRPPATNTERRVARLWSQLLQAPLEQIGRDSLFTELGGTSLSTIRLAIALDRLVTIGELRDTPTVAKVAALVDRKLAARAVSPDRP